MSEHLARILRDADRATAAGRPRVAWLLLSAAMQIDPDATPIAIGAAQALIDHGEHVQAVALLDDVIARAGHAPAFACRARAWDAAGDAPRAADDAVEALARAPADAATASLLAGLLLNRGDIALSVAVLGRAIDAGADATMLQPALTAGLRAIPAPGRASQP